MTRTGTGAAWLAAIVCAAIVCAAIGTAQEPTRTQPDPQQHADERPQGERPASRPTGVLARDEQAQAGYTLVAPLRSTTTYLVGLDGEVAHRWESDAPPGQAVRLLEDGRLLRCERVDGNPTFRGGGEGGRVKLLEPDGSVSWSFEYSDEQHLQHHDATLLPDGNLLLVAWERKTPQEVLAAGRDPDLVPEQGMWFDHLVEVKPTGKTGGEVVWEWHAWDHLVQDRDRDKPGFGRIAEHPGRIDINADAEREEPTDEALEAELRKLRELGYLGGDDEDDDDQQAGRRGGPPRRADFTHVNSIDYDPERDLIVLSVRELSEVWVIDHSTTRAEAAGSEGGRHGRGGDLLLRFGNPQVHGAGTEADRQLFHQHDAQVIPAGRPGAGNLLVFNNGSDEDGRAWSTVDEIALPLDEEGRLRVPAGGGTAPARVVWSYAPTEGDERVFSSHISGAERLANGNTLVCCGEQGRVLEVTADGELAWDWRNPFEDDRAGPGAGRRGPHGPRDRPERGEGRPEGRDRPFPPPPGLGGPPQRGMRGPGGPRGGPGGPGGPMTGGLFRVRRYAPDHPGLQRVLATAEAAEASSKSGAEPERRDG